MNVGETRNVVRLGLVGAGRWGRVFIRTIAPMEGIELFGLASSNPASRELVPAGCCVTNDWRDLLSSADLDGIIVATPPSSHVEIAKSGVEAGLGVLAEKPLTLNEREAESLLHLTKHCQGFVLVDHTHLFNPAYIKLKEVAQLLGPIQGIRSIAGNWGLFRQDSPVLWDWGSHDVAMCLDLVGSMPTEVRARRVEVRETEHCGGEILFLQLAFEQNISAEITIGNIMEHKKRILEVDFQDKTLIFNDLSDQKLKVRQRHAKDWDEGEAVEIDKTLPLTRVISQFSEMLREGQRGLESLQLGVNVVKVLSKLDHCLQI